MRADQASPGALAQGDGRSQAGSEDSRREAGRRVRWGRLALLAAIGVALGLRLWGIGFAPTAPRARPDEEIFTDDALRFFGVSQPKDVIATGWPEGFFLIVQGLQWIEALVLRARFGRDVNLGCLYAVNPIAVQILPRVFSAVMSALGCLWIGLAVRRLSPKRSGDLAAAVGALALATNYLNGRDGHFGVSDATLCSFIALSLYLCVRALQDGAPWLLGAGAAAGAGFAVKYSAAPLLAPCVFAGIGCIVRHRGRRLAALAWGLAAIPAAALAFAALCPDGALHPADTLNSLRSHHHRYENFVASVYTLDPQNTYPPGWKFHLGVSIPAALGWFGLAAAVGGMAMVWKRDRWGLVVLGLSAAGFFAIVAPVNALFARYGSPLATVLSAGVGVALSALLDVARERVAGWGGALASVVVLGLVLGPPGRRLAQFDRILSQPDTRDLASAWLVARGPGATVYPEGSYAHVHAVEAAGIAACRDVLPPSLFREVPTLPGNQGDWKRIVSRGRSAWGLVSHEAIDGYLWRAHPRVPVSMASYRTQARSVLECGRLGKAEGWEPLDPTCWKEAAAFSPGAPACGSYVDEFDSFYVPLVGLDGQVRPGPEIRVYENQCNQGR